MTAAALRDGAISNLGIIDIIGDSSISNDALSNTQLTVDATKTLTLISTIVTGGTLTSFPTRRSSDLSAINTAAVNGGQVTVDATKTLTLDNTTVTGTTIADNGTVKVDATKTLNLSGVALSGGAIRSEGHTSELQAHSDIVGGLRNDKKTVDASKTR